MSRLFVRDSTDLHRRVAELDEVVDPDGRYRTNEIFCLDHTWRSALTELVLRCDCTLLDARGFTPAHQGVAYEISQLVQLVPLSTVLVLTNESTDHTFLEAVLDDAWQTLESTSPNKATNSPLCAFNVRSDSRMDLRAMISVLAERTTSVGGAG